MQNINALESFLTKIHVKGDCPSQFAYMTDYKVLP